MEAQHYSNGAIGVQAGLTALLRLAARVAKAPAVILERRTNGTVAVACSYGIGLGDAETVVLTKKLGERVEGGYSVALVKPIVDDTGASRARLWILDYEDRTIEPAARATIASIAAEIAELVVHPVEELDPREVFNDRVRLLAQSVSESADPYVVLEAPRIGNVPTIVYVNRVFESFFGYAAVDLIGTTAERLFGSMTDRRRIEFIRDALLRGSTVRTQAIMYKAGGFPVWIEMDIRPVVDPSGTIVYYAGTMRDVSARKEFETALFSERQKLRVTLASIGDAVIMTVGDERIEFVNAAACSTLGLTSFDAYGRTLTSVLHFLEPGTDQPFDAVAAWKKSGAPTLRGYADRLTESGKRRTFSFHLSPIDSYDREAQGYVVALTAVTADVRLNRRLSFEATHDPLTGLTNRRLFLIELEASVESARSSIARHAVAYLDLDRFKEINDRCGHAAGDTVLRDVAKAIAAVVRERDVFARIGGDEFALLMRDCTLEGARTVAETIRSVVGAYRFTCDGGTLGLGISIGIAPLDALCDDAEAVLAVADTACYAAKAAGRNLVIG